VKESAGERGRIPARLLTFSRIGIATREVAGEEGINFGL